MKKVSNNKNKTEYPVKQSNSENFICNFHTLFSESFELWMLLTTKTFSLTILFLCLVKLMLFETNFVFMLFALMLFGNSPKLHSIYETGKNKKHFANE